MRTRPPGHGPFGPFTSGVRARAQRPFTGWRLPRSLRPGAELADGGHHAHLDAHLCDVPRRSRDGDRQQVPDRARRAPPPGRLRSLPGRARVAPAELEAAPGGPEQHQRRGPDPLAPRPLRLPARPGAAGLRRADVDHRGHRRAGGDHPPRQRPPAGGGRRVRPPRRLLPPRPAAPALHRDGRRAQHQDVPDVPLPRDPRPRRRRALHLPAGRAHPRLRDRAGRGGRLERAAVRRPGAARPPRPAGAGGPAGGPHRHPRVDLRRPRPPRAAGRGARRLRRRRPAHHPPRRVGHHPGLRGRPHRAGAGHPGRHARARGDPVGPDLRGQPDGPGRAARLPRAPATAARSSPGRSASSTGGRACTPRTPPTSPARSTVRASRRSSSRPRAWPPVAAWCTT